jgi:hypothetical protein
VLTILFVPALFAAWFRVQRAAAGKPADEAVPPPIGPAPVAAE